MGTMDIAGCDLRHWHHFVDNFHVYFDLIANEYLQNMAAFRPADLFGFGCMMFHGNTPSMLRLFIDHVLSSIFRDRIVKRKATFVMDDGETKMDFMTSPFHVEIDVEAIESPKAMIDFIARNLARSRCIGEQKHVVVLHGMDCLRESYVYAFRKILESHSDTMTFVMSCRNLARVNEAIRSRCALLRCNITDVSIDRFLERFVEDRDLDELTYDTRVPFVHNLVFLGKDAPPSSQVEHRIRSFIDGIVQTHPSTLAAIPHARMFAHVILRFHVPLASVLRTVVDFVSEREGIDDDAASLVALAARLEHKASRCHKPHLALERVLIEVHRRLVVAKTA